MTNLDYQPSYAAFPMSAADTRIAAWQNAAVQVTSAQVPCYCQECDDARLASESAGYAWSVTA